MITRRIAINLVNIIGEPVCNHNLFEKAPKHELQSICNPSIIKRVFFTELVRQVLRSFNGPGNQLWIEHDIQGKYTKVPLRLLIPSVYLNGITHSLESME